MYPIRRFLIWLFRAKLQEPEIVSDLSGDASIYHFAVFTSARKRGSKEWNK